MSKSNDRETRNDQNDRLFTRTTKNDLFPDRDGENEAKNRFQNRDQAFSQAKTESLTDDGGNEAKNRFQNREQFSDRAKTESFPEAGREDRSDERAFPNRFSGPSPENQFLARVVRTEKQLTEDAVNERFLSRTTQTEPVPENQGSTKVPDHAAAKNQYLAESKQNVQFANLKNGDEAPKGAGVRKTRNGAAPRRKGRNRRLLGRGVRYDPFMSRVALHVPFRPRTPQYNRVHNHKIENELNPDGVATIFDSGSVNSLEVATGVTKSQVKISGFSLHLTALEKEWIESGFEVVFSTVVRSGKKP